MYFRYDFHACKSINIDPHCVWINPNTEQLKKIQHIESDAALKFIVYGLGGKVMET